jgi:AraC-like DNA-binding protein
MASLLPARPERPVNPVRGPAIGRYRRRVAAVPDPALPLPLLDLLETAPFVLHAGEAMRRLLDTILTVPGTSAGRSRGGRSGHRGGEAGAAAPLAPVWLGPAAITHFVDEARAAGKIGDAPAIREHPAVAAARDLVRRRLGERIGLGDLAGAGHVAPEHLIRLFRQRLGTTPVRYLWATRLRLGVHLLEHSDLPVAEIAARIGCQSPKHFARLVRAEVGAPPREIRRRSWSYAARTGA